MQIIRARPLGMLKQTQHSNSFPLFIAYAHETVFFLQLKLISSVMRI